MTDRDLMKWALYALEGSNAYDWPVVEELKERLAQPEQEPVAYLHNETELLRLARRANSSDFEPSHWRPLYTAPSKQWVGLTEREVELIDEMIETQLLHAERCDHITNSTMAQKQKAWDLERVELLRKLKEKNT